MQQKARVQFQSPPEDGSVEVVCVSAVDGVQVAGGGQLGCELAPGHLQDLVGDVSLDHLDKVLHLMPVKLQLPKLHRASGAFNQRWGGGTEAIGRLFNKNYGYISFISETPYHGCSKTFWVITLCQFVRHKLDIYFFLISISEV